MIRAFTLILVIPLLAAATACGGGGGDPDRVLQLHTGPLTEDQFRSLIQETVADQDTLEILCAALDGLTDNQAAQAFEQAVAVQAVFVSDPAVGFVFADEKRSVQIVREECQAVY